MICIIRIRGQVGLNKKIVETLYRMRLRRKYSCIVVESTKENLGMIKKIRNFVAYGELDDAAHKELVKKRGKKDKLFFRLHPPRGGIKSKLHYPKGVLGDHGKKINELVKRML